ncbi:hypothetical protein MXB_2005 [Myxobolus squamalis]|nr:hypothetical protein MXB_2005 [Myxobolus squamalis]
MADLKFIGSYGQGYPETCEDVLDSITAAVVCGFNRPGTLLAVGCNDGRIVIWDIITRNIVKSVSIHVHPITSISWSRYGHFILVGSSDWSLSVINTINFEIKEKIMLNSQITTVEYNPRNNNYALVCMHRDFAAVFNLENLERRNLYDFEINAIEKSRVAKYDRRGKFIYMENGKGKLTVFNSETLDIFHSFFIRTHTSALTSSLDIEFSHRGRDDFLINCLDRTIRLYRCQDVLQKSNNLTPIQCFKDLINKSIWTKCCFSNDGEYVVAGTSRQHSIFIWERNTGGLVKIINGTKGEILKHLTCHPLRPIIYSVSGGLISVWNNSFPECWSAYAPNFKELEENIEYEEHEDEFDIEDEDKPLLSHQSDPNTPKYSEHIDILSFEKPIYCSSDEDGYEIHINALSIVGEEIFNDKEDSM